MFDTLNGYLLEVIVSGYFENIKIELSGMSNYFQLKKKNELLIKFDYFFS